MGRNFFKVIITFLLFVQPASVFAENVERILFSGSELLYPLPKGFCNITEDLQGILMKAILDKQKDPMIPVAQLIIGPCQPKNSDPEYPWGWVGLMKDSAGISQELFNTMMAKFITNDDIMEKLTKRANKSSSEALDELFGVEVSHHNNENRIIWADKDSLLVHINAATQVDGILIKEVALSSTTVIEGLYIYTYLYNLEDANPSSKEMSLLLIENAPVLKRLN